MGEGRPKGTLFGEIRVMALLRGTMLWCCRHLLEFGCVHRWLFFEDAHKGAGVGTVCIQYMLANGVFDLNAR